MDRKQQLQQIIQLNKQAVDQSQTTISSLQEELDQIERQERKTPSRKLLQLREQFKQDPKNEALRAELTSVALKNKQGDFAVWRGGLTNGPDANYIEITQPLFNSENRLVETPVITQGFEALYIDGLEDLKTLLPLNPTGLVSLPLQAFHPFREVILGTEDPDRYLVNQPLYDTQLISPLGTGQLNFFQIPLGGFAAGKNTHKTQIDTNMDQGGSLPYPKQFSITGISVYPEASTPYEDTVKLMESAWIRLFIGTRDYLVTPLSLAAVGVSRKNPLVSFRLSNPCLPVYPLPEPIDLIPQQNFRVEINFPVTQTFSKPFAVKTVLHGSFSRSLKN